MSYQSHERGLALLVTLLTLTVLLGVSASLLNVTLKQYQFSNIGLQSEMAFQAAHAGMECIMYHDNLNYPFSKFAVNGNGTGVAPETNLNCMGVNSNDLVNGGNTVVSGEEQRFQYSWGNPGMCTNVSIYKYYSNSAAQDMSVALGKPGTCAVGVNCTVIRSRGYNLPCASILSPRAVERELTQRY